MQHRFKEVIPVHIYQGDINITPFFSRRDRLIAVYIPAKPAPRIRIFVFFKLFILVKDNVKITALARSKFAQCDLRLYIIGIAETITTSISPITNSPDTFPLKSPSRELENRM